MLILMLIFRMNTQTRRKSEMWRDLQTRRRSKRSSREIWGMRRIVDRTRIPRRQLSVDFRADEIVKKKIDSRVGTQDFVLVMRSEVGDPRISVAVLIWVIRADTRLNRRHFGKIRSFSSEFESLG